MGFFKARGVSQYKMTRAIAFDTFLQTEGNLTAKTLPSGGTWAGAGDEADFKVIGESDLARRTTKSDFDLNTGRYAIAGSTEAESSAVSIRVASEATLNDRGGAGGHPELRQGVFLRYVDVNNWLMAYVGSTTEEVATVAVAKRVAGTVTILETYSFKSRTLQPTDIELFANDAGGWRASFSWPSKVLEGYDATLKTGGTLGKGKAGFYDSESTSKGLSRDYEAFTFSEGEAAGRVLFSGRTCRLTDDGFTRQNSTGAYEGQASIARGMNLYLQPGLNRLVIALRRNDTDTEESGPVTDKHSTEIIVRERFLVPR